MRLLLATLSSIALAGIAYGQIVSSPEQVIRRMIESGSLEGHDRKVIGGMGDAAAVTVTKVLAGRNLSANDIDSVLVILNSSFADLRFVEVVSDREPRTALFVLHSLDSSTKDPELKKRIADTKKYVQEQHAKSMQDSPKR